MNKKKNIKNLKEKESVLVFFSLVISFNWDKILQPKYKIEEEENMRL